MVGIPSQVRACNRTCHCSPTLIEYFVREDLSVEYGRKAYHVVSLYGTARSFHPIAHPLLRKGRKMATKTIKAIEAVKFIRSGMTDAALMDEFQISAGGLQKLFTALVNAGILSLEELEARLSLSHVSVIVDIPREKFPAARSKKPVIDAADARNCIRSGMSDAALMKRYNLSVRGIQSLMNKLVASGVISYAAIAQRGSANQKSIVLEEKTETPEPEEGITARINAAEILSHLRAGRSHESILEGYGISWAELDELLDEVLDQGLVTELELDSSLRQPQRNFEIKHRFSGDIMYEGMAPSFVALAERAVAEGVDLSESNMAGMNLAGAVLSGGRFVRADLRRVNMVRADLTGAKLAEATLVSSDMTGAILYKANLARADLSDANMSMVNAAWAFLARANLSETNLTNADLSGTNLSDAQMFETILTGTDMTGAYLKSGQT